MFNFLRKNYFLIFLVILFIVTDAVIYVLDPVNNLSIFYKNDFNKTKMLHPGDQWEKIIFGNSTVIASYIEEDSQSGFINLGISYGKVTDLDAILNKKHMKVTKEIVLGLNFFVLMDSLPTDPYYQWHKKIYEPCLYFYRDQFKKVLVNGFQNKFTGKPFVTKYYTSTAKELYHGCLSDELLQKKADEYEAKYGNMQLKDFQQNIEALDNVISYCDKNNIRLRVIWMPWNSYSAPPAYVGGLKNEVNGILNDNNIEMLDWSGKFETKYFHDLGHLNYEEGAPKFSKEIEQWLKS